MISNDYSAELEAEGRTGGERGVEIKLQMKSLVFAPGLDILGYRREDYRTADGNLVPCYEGLLFFNGTADMVANLPLGTLLLFLGHRDN